MGPWGRGFSSSSSTLLAAAEGLGVAGCPRARAASAPGRAFPCLLFSPLRCDMGITCPFWTSLRNSSFSSPLTGKYIPPFRSECWPLAGTRILSWNFRDGKRVGSRSRKSLGKLRSCLSEKLKSSPGQDNIYSISLVLFHSFSVNPYFHTNLLFTFVAGDLVWRYLSYILCVIIFQLQIITGRHGRALASLFITLCARQFILPDGARVSHGQVP